MKIASKKNISAKKINIGKTEVKPKAAESVFDYIAAHKEIMDELKEQKRLLMELLEKQIGDKNSSYDQSWLKKFVNQNK